jgi:hypothetical protein
VCSGVFRNLPLSGERLVGVCLREEIGVEIDAFQRPISSCFPNDLRLWPLSWPKQSKEPYARFRTSTLLIACILQEAVDWNLSGAVQLT